MWRSWRWWSDLQGNDPMKGQPRAHRCWCRTHLATQTEIIKSRNVRRSKVIEKIGLATNPESRGELPRRASGIRHTDLNSWLVDNLLRNAGPGKTAATLRSNIIRISYNAARTRCESAVGMTTLSSPMLTSRPA